MKKPLDHQRYRGYSVCLTVLNVLSVLYAVLGILDGLDSYLVYIGLGWPQSFGLFFHTLYYDTLEPTGFWFALIGLSVTTFLNVWFHRRYAKN